MKKLSLICIILISSIAFARKPNIDQFPVRSKNGQALTVAKDTATLDTVRVIPHLAVNEEWVSEMTIRSDAEFEQCLVLEFYDAAGNPVVASFYDSFDTHYEDTGFVIPDLQPFEIYSLDFDGLGSGARNMQVHVLSNSNEVYYGLEAAYHRFSGGAKVASVGVPIEAPGDMFILNLDQRLDPYSGNKRLRGFAVSNVDGLDCNCDVTLYNSFGLSEDGFGIPYPQRSITIPAFGKWVGSVYQLFPEVDDLIGDSLGYLYFECDNPASVMGLGFERGTAVATSISIDFFVLTKNKDGKMVRTKRR